MIDSYFNGWLGIAILLAGALLFAYAGGYGYLISVICSVTAGAMIEEKTRDY